MFNRLDFEAHESLLHIWANIKKDFNFNNPIQTFNSRKSFWVEDYYAARVRLCRRTGHNVLVHYGGDSRRSYHQSPR